MFIEEKIKLTLPKLETFELQEIVNHPDKWKKKAIRIFDCELEKRKMLEKKVIRKVNI